MTGQAVEIGAVLRDRFRRHRWAAWVSEGYGQVRQLPVKIKLRGGITHRLGLGRRGVWRHVEGVPLGAEHCLRGLVMGLEVTVGNRPWPLRLSGDIVDKPGRVLPDQHIGVDQGAATKPAGDEGLDPPERPYIEHAIETVSGVPEVLRQQARASGKGPGGKATPTLENQDLPAGLSQPARRDRGPET